MDAVRVFDIFIFGQIDVHRTVTHAITAVNALFQVASDQQFFKSEFSIDILESIQKGGIGTKETAKEPIRKQSANQDHSPDNDPGKDQIGQSADDEIRTEIHEERTFVDCHQYDSHDQYEVFDLIELLLIEERQMFQQPVFSAPQLKEIFLQCAQWADIAAELSADKHCNHADQDTQHDCSGEEKHQIGKEAESQNSEADNCIRAKSVYRCAFAC